MVLQKIGCSGSGMSNITRAYSKCSITKKAGTEWEPYDEDLQLSSKWRSSERTANENRWLRPGIFSVILRAQGGAFAHYLASSWFSWNVSSDVDMMKSSCFAGMYG